MLYIPIVRLSKTKERRKMGMNIPVIALGALSTALAVAVIGE